MAEVAEAEVTETETTTEVKVDETSDDSGTSAGKTLTQAEVDRIVEQRLARERKRYADYDELKAKAKKVDELEAANLSELEKAQKKAEELETKLSQKDEMILEAQIRNAALAKGVDPEGALDALRGSRKELLDPSDMVATMDQLLEARPNLSVKSNHTPGVDQGARGTKAGQLTAADLDNMSPQEISAARSEGRLQSLLGT